MVGVVGEGCSECIRAGTRIVVVEMVTGDGAKCACSVEYAC
jgi:hypothetical protein